MMDGFFLFFMLLLMPMHDDDGLVFFFFFCFLVRCLSRVVFLAFLLVSLFISPVRNFGVVWTNDFLKRLWKCPFYRLPF